MGQMGFFDLSKRYTGLDTKNEPLAKIDEVVPWEDFRGCLDAVWRRSGQGAQVAGGTQAVGRGGDVQDDHSERTLQSVGRSG